MSTTPTPPSSDDDAAARQELAEHLDAVEATLRDVLAEMRELLQRPASR